MCVCSGSIIDHSVVQVLQEPKMKHQALTGGDSRFFKKHKHQSAELQVLKPSNDFHHLHSFCPYLSLPCSKWRDENFIIPRKDNLIIRMNT